MFMTFTFTLKGLDCGIQFYYIWVLEAYKTTISQNEFYDIQKRKKMKI